MAITYSVLIDWNNNGVYTDANEVQPVLEAGGVAITAGRDQPRTFSPIRAAQAAWSADNRDKRFSDNTGSGLIGANLLPYRPCKIRATDGVTTWDLFTGVVDDWNVKLDNYPMISADFTALDKLAWLATVSPLVPLSNGLRTDQAVAAVLDAVSWPAGARTLDTGYTTLGYWWVSDATALAALQSLADHEQGFIYIDRTGNLVFENRYNRSDRVNTSSFTWNDTANVSKVAWRTGIKDVINRCTVTVQPRTPDGAASVVWQYGATLTLGANEPANLYAKSSDPFQSPIIPLGGTDYTVTGGSVAGISVVQVGGATAIIGIVAGSAGCTLTGLQLRATAVKVLHDVVWTVDDTASQATYGLKTLDLPLPYLQSALTGRDAAQAIVGRYKDPQEAVDVTLKAGTVAGSGTNLPDVVNAKISDRVTLSLPSIGVAWSGFIESLKHRIRYGLHETTYTVQKLVFPQVMTLDDNVLGTIDTGPGLLGW